MAEFPDPTPAPPEPGSCLTCGELAKPMFWDPQFGLWRAKCSKIFIVATSGTNRPSPHVGATILVFFSYVKF